MQPGYRYTKAQMRAMLTEEKVRDLQFKGYVLRLDDEGYYSLVHHSKAFGGRKLGDKKQGDLTGSLIQGEPVGEAYFEKPAAIVKRTPQQRLESMVQKFWPTVKDLGHIPGLKDEDLLPIMANARMRSLDPKKERMTADDIRAIAGELLRTAEAKHEEKLSKQITRHED